MDKLQVIEGVKKMEPDYIKIYCRMFEKNLREMKQQKKSNGICDKDLYKRTIFTGVRFIRHTKSDSLDHEFLSNKFLLIGYLQELIKELTPREFINIFPITKEYDGHICETKDYFFTIDRAKEIGMDTPIKENILEFLYDYTNWDITVFTVSSMTIMSNLRRIEGKKSLAEEFFEDAGIDTYTMHTDQQGKQNLTNNRTGETQEVKKTKPRYLKPVQ
ncbi:hypothetical protein M3Y14_15880 [Bacillus thuringiensis]|uniref:hypothetical protein n=1 Tax=Bacillus thuringiensis TaxID=1428 RepID=UPI00222438E0|nr:hypothetical protein [Bacillus thuringiensis]UYX50065.1 hypothetical protein M3Y14_15880 [Bacillus thuringiensis]